MEREREREREREIGQGEGECRRLWQLQHNHCVDARSGQHG